MQENASCNAPKINGAKNSIRRIRALVLLGAGASALTACASATSFDINATVGPILDGVAALIPSIINLIIAVVPAIIVLAVVGFVVKFLDSILTMLHIK